jgi:hypothetical protein
MIYIRNKRKRRCQTDMKKPEEKCCSCGTLMKFACTFDFRTGGTPEKFEFPFDKLADVKVNLLPLNVYVCPDCGRIELKAGKAIQDALLHIADKYKHTPSTV